MFEYKMVQIPQNIAINEKHKTGSDAAEYLETVVNKYAQNDWEFQRIDAIGVLSKPQGCMAALTGKKEEYMNYHVITFRKQK